MTTWREALTSTGAESQTRVQAQSRAMPNVFNVGMLSNAQFGRECDEMDEKDDQIAHHGILADGKSQRIMGQITIRQPQVLDADLAHISPLAFGHIIPNGTYWFDRDLPSADGR